MPVVFFNRPVASPENATPLTLPTVTAKDPVPEPVASPVSVMVCSPEKLMDRYFDAFVYVANWGTHRLMFRIPRRVLDVEAASA